MRVGEVIWFYFLLTCFCSRVFISFRVYVLTQNLSKSISLYAQPLLLYIIYIPVPLNNQSCLT